MGRQTKINEIRKKIATAEVDLAKKKDNIAKVIDKAKDGDISKKVDKLIEDSIKQEQMIETLKNSLLMLTEMVQDKQGQDFWSGVN